MRRKRFRLPDFATKKRIKIAELACRVSHEPGSKLAKSRLNSAKKGGYMLAKSAQNMHSCYANI